MPVLNGTRLHLDPLRKLSWASVTNVPLEDAGTPQDLGCNRVRGKLVVAQDQVRTLWPYKQHRHGADGRVVLRREPPTSPEPVKYRPL